MARELKRIEGANSVARIPCRRAGCLVAGVGLLFTLMISGCASINFGMTRAQHTRHVDILIVTTDRATETEMIRALQNVENVPVLQLGEQPWSQGHLTGLSDGSVYTIVVGGLEGHDDATIKSTIQKSTSLWRPRYVLVLGTTPAVAYDEPLGAVGLVTLICDFDLDLFEEFGSSGNCHRPDGGLFASARSVADEWETAASVDPSRAGCASARVMKLAALSGNPVTVPGLAESAMKLSEELHRGLILEREGILAVKSVDEFRSTAREPIGLLMIRGVSEIPSPGTRLNDEPDAREAEQQQLQSACAARDTADFAVELIRRRWPVSSSAKR
jgi:hypothetical protein